jgi:hypothetical protein
MEVFKFAHFSLLRWCGVHRAGRAFQPLAADRHGAACRYPFVGGFCFLVATPGVQDLLLSAKHLFVSARPFES